MTKQEVDHGVFRPSGTVLPKGEAALRMIDDALDHLVDGPRTSFATIRRLLIRAVGSVPVGPEVRNRIEQFEYMYALALDPLPDLQVTPDRIDGGIRGQLVVLETLLRVEWEQLRGVIVEARRNGLLTQFETVGSEGGGGVTSSGAINDPEWLMLKPPEMEKDVARRRRVRIFKAVFAVLAAVVALIGLQI